MVSITTTSAIQHLPDSSLTEAVSYLTFPESVARVSKRMKQVAEDAAIYATRDSSLLRGVHSLFDRTLGASSNESRRARQVRTFGIQLIKKYSYLFSAEEWKGLGYNPNSYEKGPWNFDRMQSLIRNRRSQNLIELFERITVAIPKAKKFADSLPETLSPHGKANQIREWMKYNQKLLAEIQEINLENIEKVPAEILLCPNLALPQLEIVFKDSYQRRNLELFENILKNPRFSEIPDGNLKVVYQKILERNDLPFLTALICSPKGGSIFLFIENCLCSVNHDFLKNTILASKILPKIPAVYIGNAALKSASRGDAATYLRLASLNQFAHISIKQIGSILVNAALAGNLQIANHIMKDLRIDFISINDLEDALKNGLHFLNPRMIQLLLTHSNIREIDKELLEESRKFVSN